MARRRTYASYARAFGLPADSTAAIARSMARIARSGATSSNMRVLSPRRSNSEAGNTKRYNGLTREQQQRRNKRIPDTPRQYRTLADMGLSNLPTPYSTVLRSTASGQLGERISTRSGQLVTGRQHAARRRQIRAAFGLSVG